MVLTPLTDTVGGDLPIRLGGDGVTTGALNSDFDVFTAGLALNLHITKDTPYQRQTADWKKNQVDQEPEAGEQSISDWWIRSQMSFQLGAGIDYLDTIVSQNDTNRQRFDDSRGVDVWTPGKVSRLPDTTLAAAVSGSTFLIPATDRLIYGAGTTLKGITSTGTVTYNYGSVNAIKSMTTDGTRYFVATSDGLFSGPLDNSAPGALLWNLPTAASVTLGWSKQRLMAGVDNAMYELGGTGPTLPSALYTHPSPGWRWNTITDGPDSVVAGGAAGLNSGLYAFPLSTDQDAPKLTPGLSLAVLPTGETVQSLYFYVGTQLLIGTSKGLRIGTYDSYYGTFNYGPLTGEFKIGAVTALTARGSFAYCGCNIGGEAMLVRVDLGGETEKGVYAYATDLRAPTSGISGRVTALTPDANGLLAFAVQGQGVYREGTGPGTARTAWLRTARIRMNTVESKNFKYGRVRCEGAGIIEVVAETPLASRSVINLDGTDPSQRFGLVDGAAEWVRLTFNLTGGVVLTSYQVLALPAQARQRLFALPVQLFDNEVNRSGKRIGYPGRARDYLNALEAIESSGDELTVQCPPLGIDAVRCTVERIEFTQASPPTGGKAFDLGGYANLVFRTST